MWCTPARQAPSSTPSSRPSRATRQATSHADPTKTILEGRGARTHENVSATVSDAIVSAIITCSSWKPGNSSCAKAAALGSAPVRGAKSDASAGRRPVLRPMSEQPVRVLRPGVVVQLPAPLHEFLERRPPYGHGKKVTHQRGPAAVGVPFAHVGAEAVGVDATGVDVRHRVAVPRHPGAD